MARYVGGRIVPTHGGVWDGSKSYEELTIVLREDTGDSYISKRAVPAGVDIGEEHYWVLYSVYNEQITRAEEHLDSTASAICSEMNTQKQEVTQRMEQAEETCDERAAAAERAADARATAAETISNQNKTALEQRMANIEVRQDANIRASTDESADYAAEVVDARVDSGLIAHDCMGEMIRAFDKRLGNEVFSIARSETEIPMVVLVPLEETKGNIDPDDGVVKNGYRPVSTLFSVDDDAVSFEVNCEGYAFRMFRYDDEGNLIRCENWVNKGSAVYEPEKGTQYRIHFDTLSVPNNSTSPSIAEIQRALEIKQYFWNGAAHAVLFGKEQGLTYQQMKEARDNIQAAYKMDYEILKRRIDVGGTITRITEDYYEWAEGAINSNLQIGDSISFGSEAYYTHCYINCEPGDTYYFTFRVSSAKQIFAVGTDLEGNVIYYEPPAGDVGSFENYEINIPASVQRLYLCSQTAAAPSTATLFIIRKYIPKDLASADAVAAITQNVYSTVRATIDEGATEGKWVSLTGKNTGVVVRCDSSDVITSYYVNYLDEEDQIKVQICELGKWYYFPTLRDSIYQIQIRAVGYVTSEGTTVGGNVEFRFAKTDDLPIAFEQLAVNSVDTIQIVDGAITTEKLSDEVKESLDAKITRDETESMIDDAVEMIRSNSLESYVQENVSSVCSELMEIQNANTSSIVWMTDLHVLAYGDNTDHTMKPLQRAMKAIQAIDKTNALDFYVLGGDYLWNNAQSTTRERAVRAYQLLQSACYELRDKLYACKGNHDDNSIASSTLGLDVVVYPDEEYLYLGKQYEKSGVILDAGNHERFYGYYDIPSQKIRLIFINTVDIPYISKDGDLTYKGQGTVSISEEQNLFIQNALKFEEPGWGVMFFSHHGIVKSDVVSAYVGQLWGVIQAYKTNTTFTQTFNTIWGSYTVDVDYTDNPSNEVIACVCGHNHADRSQVVDGALVVSTGCACPSQPSEIDGESVSPTYETATETLLDILTIDRKKGKLYATRYGLGRSREFNYNTISGEIGEITE